MKDSTEGEGTPTTEPRRKGNPRPIRFGVITSLRLADYSAWEAAHLRRVPVQQFMRSAVQAAAAKVLRDAQKTG